MDASGCLSVRYGQARALMALIREMLYVAFKACTL
jgi:hypothetical protein